MVGVAHEPEERVAFVGGAGRMPVTDPALWSVIESYDFPYRPERDVSTRPPRYCQDFAQNLRRLGGWSDQAGRNIVAEYRRFLYLAAMDGGNLTPPEPVWLAWQLHLGMEDDFAARFCPAIGLDFAPEVAGSRADGLTGYGRTLARYRAEFGTDPPAEIWPPLWRMRLQPWLRPVFEVTGAVLICGAAIFLTLFVAGWVTGDGGTWFRGLPWPFVDVAEQGRVAAFANLVFRVLLVDLVLLMGVTLLRPRLPKAYARHDDGRRS